MAPKESVRAWRLALLLTSITCLFVLLVQFLAPPLHDSPRAGVLGWRLLLLLYWAGEFLYLGAAAAILLFVMLALKGSRSMWVLMCVPYLLVGHLLFGVLNNERPFGEESGTIFTPIYLAVPFLLVLHGLLFAMRARSLSELMQ